MSSGFPDQLHWLQDWVSREFGEGPVETMNPWVTIETNDPGWAVTIALSGTRMEGIEFETIDVPRSETDWVSCWVDGEGVSGYVEWQGRCATMNLAETLGLFRNWVERHNATA